MHLIVGLGNPGRQYDNTRHNIGFRVVEEISSRCECDLVLKRALNSLFSKAVVEGSNVILLLPQTYMNNSGLAVHAVMKKYGLKPGQLIVVHDEIDLPPGSVRIKNGGGTAGHNGLRSITGHLGAGDFIRIRVGIGKPDKEKVSGAEYVLSVPSKSEKKLLKEAVLNAADAVECIIMHGLERAMNLFNKKT